MDQQVDDETKQRRYEAVMEVQQNISRDKHRAFIGKTLEVVVEGLSDETDLLLQGRMSQQAPDIDGVVLINDGQANIGEFVRVKITESMEYDLIGEIVESV
jgi:ribosomal protein S12 methylthiotransferase